MRIMMVLMILLVPLSVEAITRGEVDTTATNEANRTYYSAPSGLDLYNNYFHPNYSVSSDCPDHSTLPECNYIDTTTYFPCSWTGAPYCYGGNYMGDACQNRISSGYAIAHTCHYDYYFPDDINNWAAGIDCAAFVCECLGLGTDISTSDLPSNCQEITWGELQKGDLIINPGSHVLMFIEWVDQNTGLMKVAETSGALNEVEIRSVQKSFYESSYTPYKPDCLAGDPAAKVAGFKVEVDGGVVRLKWKTECERDTRCFWIERALSKEGPWEKVTGEIEAKGTDTEGASYEVVDSGYSDGLVYYRLMEREVGYRVLVDRIEVCRN